MNRNENEPVYEGNFDPNTGFEPQQHPPDESAIKSVAILTQPQFYFPIGSIQNEYVAYHLKQKRQHQILLGQGDTGIVILPYKGNQFSHDFQAKVDVKTPEVQDLLTQERAPESDLFFIFEGLLFPNTHVSLPVVQLPEPSLEDRIRKLERIIESTTSEADRIYFQRTLAELLAAPVSDQLDGESCSLS